MLRQLYIHNFTLIDELQINFNPGFSVITGETGAGKSIILGAISLLLGNRADSKQIKNGESKCVIEAHFDINDYHLDEFFLENDIDYDASDCILRRELTQTGKSRAFINDIPVALATIKKLGEQLVDIHSQHQNLLLQTEDFQLQVVDIIAQNKQLLDEYKRAFNTFKSKEIELIELHHQIEKSKENEDFLRFQCNEIEQAHLIDGMQEELESRNDILTHYEEIITALNSADQNLNHDDNGIIFHLRSTLSLLQGIGNVFPKANELSDRLDSSLIELKDIAQEIGNDVGSFEFDPSELERINAQLDQIYSLEHKFHVHTIKELIDIKEDFSSQLSNIDNSDEELKIKQEELDKLKKKCIELATNITTTRKKAAKKIETDIKPRLVSLGIPNISFAVEMSLRPLNADGQDKIIFMFSANKSAPLQPVCDVASGGEIARVMLSLKAMISGAINLPTIIFDEIDIGVSGRIAEQMAIIMKEMSDEGRQVISITHLPQIAAYGTTHYKVSKQDTPNKTVSQMRELSTNERVDEIAQMLSGNNISEAAINNAKVLLKMKS